LKQELERKDKAKKQLNNIVAEKALSPFWLVKSLKAALSEAYDSGLSLECDEIQRALHLLEIVEEETRKIAEDF
jgi:division protein CdvB (Snf7/Vps24/ESCRT-III family)